MKSKFKVGDRVKYVGSRGTVVDSSVYHIISAGPAYFYVGWPGISRNNPGASYGTAYEHYFNVIGHRATFNLTIEKEIEI